MRSQESEELLKAMFDSSSEWHSSHLCNSSILVPDKNGASLMPFEFFMRQCFSFFFFLSEMKNSTVESGLKNLTKKKKS